MKDHESAKGKANAMSVSDNDLMEAVRNGKIEQLAILFERHQVMLFNFFLRLTGNRSTSEDLVQEVFMRILKYRTGFRNQSRFTVWMLQIARNAHIDHLRKQKGGFLSLEDQYADAPAPGPRPEEEHETEADIILLQRALGRLPWKKREVLVLSRIQELKIKEISELLGCRIGTVKAQVHRSLKELGRIYVELQDGRIS